MEATSSGDSVVSRHSAGSKLTSRVKSFVGEVSVIGAKNLVDESAHWTRRCVWSVLLMASFCLAIYQVQQRIVFYRSYPVQTQINIVQANELPFPQVTICNENSLRKTPAKYYGIDKVLLQMYPPWPSDASNVQQPDLSVLSSSNRTADEWLQIRLNMSQTQNSALKDCKWAEKQCTNETWFDAIFTYLGYCLAFNPGRLNLSVLRPGTNHGLKLILFVDQDEYLITNGPSAGFRILLHEPNEVPLMKESAFKASPGYLISVAVSQERILKIPAPHGDCIDAPGYYLSKCFAKCEARYIVSKCKCKLWYMTEDDAPQCDFVAHYSCAEEALYEYPSDEEGMRSCLCHPQCHSVHYNYALSYGFVSNFFSEFMQRYENTSEDALTKDYVSLEIFFSTLEYKEMTTQSSYSFMALLSDIGGALGLLLGATVLTIYEVLEFGFHLLYISIHRTKSKQAVNPMDTAAG